MTDHTEVKSPENVKFKLDGVGGPSAGLMFTLAIYDQVSGQDLKAGRKIAGTGTIEKDGSVGDIGGAYLKVKSAADSGADIFFVPNNPVTKKMKKADPDAKTNYQEAKEAAKKLGTKMKIVPVKTAQEAIDYLKKLNKKRVGQAEIHDFCLSHTLFLGQSVIIVFMKNVIEQSMITIVKFLAKRFSNYQ